MVAPVVVVVNGITLDGWPLGPGGGISTCKPFTSTSSTVLCIRKRPL
jgi:hypothetical protein